MSISLNNASIFAIILTLLVLFNDNTNGGCQINKNDSTYYVELKSYYDGQGIIFSKDDYFIKRDKSEKQIILKLSDVFQAEVILDSLTKQQYKDDSLKINEIVEKRRKYNRQYWGIQNESREKIIVMYIFNFSDPISINYFQDKDWDKGLFFSTSDFYAENSRIYWINLSKRKMENGSWPLELK